MCAAGSYRLGAQEQRLSSRRDGNYQIASMTALSLVVPSVGFMLVIERFSKRRTSCGHAWVSRGLRPGAARVFLK
jgi:hypothetical protein